MANPKTHDLATCYLSIDGFRIHGFGDGEAITFSPSAADVEHSVGEDGEVTVERTNDERLVATVTVRENSIACRRLGEIRAAQRAEATITARPFRWYNEQTGEEVSSEFAVFLDTPEARGGRRVSDRAFQILLPNGKRGQRFAPAVAN